MWKPTWRGLLARKVRLVLTAAAVLLGVGFVSATYVLTDTVRAAFDRVFAQTVTGVDLVVQGQASVGHSDPPRVPDTALGTVREVPGVARAEGYVDGYAQFVGRDGESIGGGGPPTIGASWVDGGPFRLVDDGVSRPPRRAGEVAMDASTARENGFAVGDRVRVLLDGPARTFEIVGLFGFGDTDDLGAVTFAAFDLATAQVAFDADGALEGIYVQVESGVRSLTLRQQLELALGSQYDVATPEEVAGQRAETVRGILAFFTFALLGFAAIGVAVGAFVIFNTFTILVAQRTRELGLLRAMGASRAQVVWSVVLEALAVAVVASAIGLVAGVLLGVGLLEMLRGLGQQLPETTTVLVARTVVVSLAVGIGVTVVASLLPAVRAARVSPMEAVNDVRPRPAAGMGRRMSVGLVIAVVGAGVIVLGLVRAETVSGVSEQVQVVAIGTFVLLVGVVVLLAAVVRPFVGLVGRPLRALGAPGALARVNAARNPRRTAVTSAALVIGVALVGLTATFGASAKASVRRDTASGLRADYVVKSDGFAGFSSLVAERIAELPSVDTSAALQIADAGVGDIVDTVGGMDPAVLERVVSLDFVGGGVAGVEGLGGGVLLDDAIADHLDVDVGDVVLLQLSRGTVDLPVRGIFRNDNFVGLFGQEIPIVVSRETFGVGAGGRQDTVVFVNARPGRDAEARAEMERALGSSFPNIDVLTRDRFREEQMDQVDQFLTVLIAILALAEIIAVLGIVNTLALSVFERTRELGLLRTVGMTRRQVRQMVRWESVVIAVIGAVVGLALGLLWGWLFTRSLRSEGLTVFAVPVAQVLVFLAVAVLAGILAAVVPAWRASRLDVLDAIAEE